MTERKKITLKANLSTEKLAELEEMKKPAKPAERKPFTRPGAGGRGGPRRHTPPISELGRTVKWLYKTYPDLFFKDRSKPLKRQVEKDIFEAFGDKPPVTKRMVKKALGHYVYSYSYMNGVLASKGRYDLKGKMVEELEDEHKTFAIDWLREREAEKAKKEAEGDTTKPKKN